MTDNTAIIVVDQFAHNATVCYGGERICFSLSHMYGVELVEAIESRFPKSSGSALNMDAVPYKAVGDLRYYHSTVY